MGNCVLRFEESILFVFSLYKRIIATWIKLGNILTSLQPQSNVQGDLKSSLRDFSFYQFKQPKFICFRMHQRGF